MSDAMILRWFAIMLVGILSGLLLATGAGLGAYMYDPVLGLNVHFGAELFWTRTEIGLVAFWPLGILGFLFVAGAASIKVRGRALNMLVAWACLPLAYAVGILIGIASTIVTGTTPDISF
jgi:hypothetical protein